MDRILTPSLALRVVLALGVLVGLGAPAAAQDCPPERCPTAPPPDGRIAFSAPDLGGRTVPVRTVRQIVEAMEEALDLQAQTSRTGRVGVAFGIARDGELVTRVASREMILNRGRNGLILPGHGPVHGLFDAYDDPLIGFDDPLIGFDGPLAEYDDPLIGYDDPLIGYDDPLIGYRDPFLGFRSPAAALDAIWGDGGTFVRTEYALVLIAYPVERGRAEIEGAAMIVPFDLVDGAGRGRAGAPVTPTAVAATDGLRAAPNPAAAATTLTFTLAEAAPLRVTVYDALGREVSRLADGPGEAGPHRVRLDRGGLPGGVYLVRLQAGTRVETLRLVLGH